VKESKLSGNEIAGLHEGERRRYQAIAESPHTEIMMDRQEILGLFREIGRLRLKNAELTVAESAASGSGEPTGARGVAMPILEVFAARTPNDTRIRHAFEVLGLVTLGEVSTMTAEDLLARRNFGKGCLARVKAVLAEHGLKLSD
jgi:hypothetical protein